jgi:hypothetical protein
MRNEMLQNVLESNPSEENKALENIANELFNKNKHTDEDEKKVIKPYKIAYDDNRRQSEILISSSTSQIAHYEEESRRFSSRIPKIKSQNNTTMNQSGARSPSATPHTKSKIPTLSRISSNSGQVLN